MQLQIEEGVSSLKPPPCQELAGDLEFNPVGFPFKAIREKRRGPGFNTPQIIINIIKRGDRSVKSGRWLHLVSHLERNQLFRFEIRSPCDHERRICRRKEMAVNA